MYTKSVIGRMYKLGIFCLPLMAILAQWILVAGVRLSWILPLILLCFVFVNVPKLMRQRSLLVVIFVIVLFPFITLIFSKALSSKDRRQRHRIHAADRCGFCFLLYG